MVRNLLAFPDCSLSWCTINLVHCFKSIGDENRVFAHIEPQLGFPLLKVTLFLFTHKIVKWQKNIRSWNEILKFRIRDN